MPYVYRKNNNSIMNTSNPYVICQIVHGFDQLIHCLDKKLFRNYYCEIEWQAIKHIIVFESQQILRCGVRYKSLVVNMRYWMNLIFPKWQSNFYLKLQKYGLRTKAVLSGHYFFILLYRFIVKVFLMIRNKQDYLDYMKADLSVQPESNQLFKRIFFV
ncbi:hypothetical protein BPULL_2088 [Bifidobacterium pullorum]|uniref:Uncharacterized protein n=1 Tax=Bifidobacterium pullorum TaxID=78448 RepID=A0A7V8HQ42_9BIFI|nr:hypothetical protein BPULL_2088 [Bifidobacterium pullorum]